MKKISKVLIEGVSAEACNLGFKKKRHGLVIGTCPDPDLVPALVFTAREWPDGRLDIQVFAHVYWTALETLYATGLGRSYRLADWATGAVFVNVGNPIAFGPDVSVEEETSRASGLLRDVALPTLKEMASKPALVAAIEAEVARGGGYAEKLIAADALMYGPKAARARYDALLRSGLSEHAQQQVHAFFDVWVSTQQDN